MTTMGGRQSLLRTPLAQGDVSEQSGVASLCLFAYVCYTLAHSLTWIVHARARLEAYPNTFCYLALPSTTGSWSTDSHPPPVACCRGSAHTGILAQLF